MSKVFKRCFATTTRNMNGFNHHPSTSFGCIDIHTHVYLSRYVEMLKTRNEIPKIVINGLNDDNYSMLLPSETVRSIDSECWVLEDRLAFMETHNISHSFISLPNPWIQFIDNKYECDIFTRLLNDDLQNEYCERSKNKLFGYGILPTTSTIHACCREIEHIATNLKSIKGVIIGTNGLNGLDIFDRELIELYKTIEEYGLFIMIHPHYDGLKYGSIMTRFILNGILDDCPNLNIILAHCNDALPYICDTLTNIVNNEDSEDSELIKTNKEPIKYLTENNIYYDAFTDNTLELESAINLVGVNKILFGTDNGYSSPMNSNHNHLHINGSNGINGINGTSKVNGINGANGIHNTNGYTVANGKNGANSVNGTNGINGANGINSTISHDVKRQILYENAHNIFKLI